MKKSKGQKKAQKKAPKKVPKKAPKKGKVVAQKASSKPASRKTSKKVAKKASGKSAQKASRSTLGVEATPPLMDRLMETRGTLTEELPRVRFAGVALGGGKTDKTAVAVIEYFPEEKRVFLRSLRDRISTRGETTADEALLSILIEEEKDLSTIAFDAPLQLPPCMRCLHKCPGERGCDDPEVKWMHDVHKKREKSKRPNKMFTPYTERAAEIYISNFLEEPFHPPHALGSNAAPLTARALYIARHLATPLIEVYPKLSLWRIGVGLDVPKSHLRYHRHAIDSDEARLFILKTLMEKGIAFVYQQDLRTMVDNDIAFDAFICALTAFLKYRGQTEKRPADFPKSANWLEFPKQTLLWF